MNYAHCSQEGIEVSMTNEEKRELKDKVLVEIEALKKNIKLLMEVSKPISPDNAIGRLTRIDAINAKSISEAGLRSAEVKLEKLKICLLKIDRPDFGVCVSCDEPIAIGRLMLIPESLMCIKCAEAR